MLEHTTLSFTADGHVQLQVTQSVHKDLIHPAALEQSLIQSHGANIADAQPHFWEWADWALLQGRASSVSCGTLGH